MDNCAEQAMCTDTEGSFLCTCNTGYTGDGTECTGKIKLRHNYFEKTTIFTDVDECGLNTDTCDENAECGNTQGSYMCTCLSGYSGDGSDCFSKINATFVNSQN